MGWLENDSYLMTACHAGIIYSVPNTSVGGTMKESVLINYNYDEHFFTCHQKKKQVKIKHITPFAMLTSISSAWLFGQANFLLEVSACLYRYDHINKIKWEILQ